MEDKDKAHQLLWTITEHWSKKYAIPVDAELLRDELAQIIMTKIREDLEEFCEIVPIKNLKDAMEILNDAVEAEKKSD